MKQPVEFDIIGHFNSEEFRRTVEAELAGVENIRYVPVLPLFDSLPAWWDTM